MAQYIQATPGTIAAAMGYSSQVPQSRYGVGQLGLANGGLANLPYVGGTIAGGNIQGMPMGNRTGFGLLKKLKKRVKKLIPKEAAPLMMAAAPFMGPIAGPITAGLGSYKTYGKINPMAMAMSLAPHLRIGGGGIGYGRTDGFNIGNMGGKSLRGWLTGQGPTGSGQGILKGFGNKLDASIFGKSPYVDTISGDFMKGKEGFFGTGGGKIGLEDVFKTLTTGKEGEKSLKKISAIYAASATYADALNNAERLGIPADSLSQDEYDRVKASLTGTIPTKPLIAHGGRVGHAFGTPASDTFIEEVGGEEGDIGFEEEEIIHPGTLDEGDIGIPGQPLTEFEHEGSLAKDPSKLLDILKKISMFAPGLDPLKVMQVAQALGVGVMEAIEIVKNKMGGEEVIEEQVTEGDSDWKNELLEKLNKGDIEWPSGPSIPLPGSKREPHPDDQYYPKTPNEGMQPFNAGGRVGFTEGSGSSYLNYVQAMNALGQTPMPIDIFHSLEGIMSVREMIDMGSPKGGNAQGGLPNTRTGLQWGSDKGEGLGGEEVEADMRYEGGFMPYGEEPKADDVPARLSKDEFVFTDQAVAGAGDGDIDLGAERLYNVMKSLEAGGRISEETQGEMGQGIGELI